MTLVFCDTDTIKLIANMTECVTVVKHVDYSKINGHLCLKVNKNQPKQVPTRLLKLPAKTKWYSNVQCLESLLVNKYFM